MKKKHSLQFENVNICEREQVELEKLGDAESSAMAESPKPSLGENGDLIAVDEGGISTPILEEEEEENSVDDSTATTSAGLNVDIFKRDEGHDNSHSVLKGQNLVLNTSNGGRR